MVWNKNAIRNDQMLSDAEDLDIVLEGVLELENEMLSLRDSDIDQTTKNPLSFDSNSLPHSTLLEPPSIASECVEQTDSPRAVKKINVHLNKLSFPNKKQQKRGRPQKSDDEGNVDATTLRKRTYARGYQRRKRAERKKYAKLFHSLWYNLKKIDANNPKYNGILELLEECDPEFKEMNKKD